MAASKAAGEFSIGCMKGAMIAFSVSAVVLVIGGIILRDSFYLWSALVCELLVPPFWVMKLELEGLAAPHDAERGE
jgi:hypothetical protein